MKRLLQLKSSIFSNAGQSSRLADEFVERFIRAQSLPVIPGREGDDLS
jgi:FMN-dependent NADH-azoreductase